VRHRILAFAIGAFPFVAVSAAENHRPVLTGYLIASEGNVELKRVGWSGFHPVTAGTRLEIKDQVRLASDAKATILCTDFETTWQPTRGERSDVSQGCNKPTASVSQAPEGLAINTRSTEESERIRSPRGSIRELCPSIRWESFGEQEYEVQVSLGNQIIWGPVLVDGFEQPMPPGFLKPELPYRVQVRSFGGSVFVEPTTPFNVIREDIRSKVAEGETALLAQFQDGTLEQELAHALYLAHQSLRDEALAILDSILPELNSASVELWGAHLALGLGFQYGAAERYENARKLARKYEDLETEAAASAGLGHAAIKHEQSVPWLREALLLYERLGDEIKASSLRRELERLL